MPNTFTLIASSTVGSGGASSIDFTSIPSTYTDLAIKLSLRSTDTNPSTTLCYRFNGSTSGYTGRILDAYSNTAESWTFTTLTVGGGTYGRMDGGGLTAASNTSNTFASFDIYIPNYAGSNNKSWSLENVSENNSSTNAMLEMVAGLWSNTAAINSITLVPYNGSLVQYSTAYLYGIVKS
jgi:hypothetical protein